MSYIVHVYSKLPFSVKYAKWQLRLIDNKVLSQEKINISACVNGIPYINGAREMGVYERIASVT